MDRQGRSDGRVGGGGTRRVRLPAHAAFILGPVLGGLYVLVLPLIAFVAVVVFLS
ncbi:MAG: hypothetical protein HW414_316, partial [Dehalococcoidia bacterium]|nr:hypothetical protein [Dehalococcoidia bacterium]